MIIHKVDLLEQTSFRSSHYKSLGVGFIGNILIILFCSINIVICCPEQSENIALVKQQRAHDCIWSSESSTNFAFITTCKDTTKCSKSKQTIITVTYQKHQNGIIYNKSSPQLLFFIKPTISTALESNLLVVKDALPLCYIWLHKLLYCTLMASGFEIILLFTRQLSNIAVVVGRRWWWFACQLRFQKIASIHLGDWIKTFKNISKRIVNKHGYKNKLFTRAENNIRNIPKIFSANSATLLKTFTDHSLTGSSSRRITYNDFSRSNIKSNIRENIKSEIKHYQSLNSGRRRTLGDFLLLMLFFHVYYQRQQHEKKRMQYKKEKRRKELRSDRESINFEREYCQKNQGVRIRNSCYQLNSKISATRCSLYCGNTYQKFGAHFNGNNYKSLIKINSWWMYSICYYCYNIFRCHIGVCYKCASIENLKYCRINWPLHLSQWYYKDDTHQTNPHFLLKCCYNCQSLNNNNNIIVSKTIQYNNTAVKNATAYTKLPIAVMSFIWKWKTWFDLKSELTTNFFYALGSFEVTNNIFISCYKCDFKNNKVSKWLLYHSSLTHQLLLIPRLRKLLPRIKDKTIKSISSYSYKNSMKSNDLNSNYLGLVYKLYSIIGSNALYFDMHEVNPLRLLLFNNGKYITCCVKKRRRGRRKHGKHRYLWKKFLIKVLIYCTHSNECYNIITPLQYLHNTNATTTTKIATTSRAARHCHNRFLLRSSIRLNSSKPNLVWLLIGLFWFKISKINGNINHNGNHNYLEIPYIKNLTQHEKTNHSEINKGYNNFSIGNFRLNHYPLNLRAKSACHNYEKVHLQRTPNIHRSTHDLFNNYVHNTKHKLLREEYERYQIKAKGVTSGSTSYIKGAVYVQSDEMRLESIKKQILSKLGLSGKPQIMRPLAKQFIWDTIYRADGVGSLSMYYTNKYKHNLNKRHLIDNKKTSDPKGLRLKTKVPLKIKNLYYSINKQMISENYSYNRIHQNSKHRLMVSKYEKNKFQQKKHHTHTSTEKRTMYIENYTNPFTIITPRTNIESIGTIINKSLQFETFEVLNPNFTSSFFCNRNNIHYQRGQHILTSLLKPSASTPQYYYNSNKQKNSKLNKIQRKNSNVGSMFNNSQSSTLTYLVDFTRSNEDNIDIKLDYQYDEYFNNKNDSTTKQKSQKSQRHEVNAHPNKIINNHRNIFKPYKTRSSSNTTSLHLDDIENEELFTNTEEIIIFAEEGVIYKRHHLVEFSSQNTELAKGKLIVRDAKIHLRINKIPLITERNSRYQRHATVTQQHNKKLKIWIFQLLNLNLANHSNDQAFKFCESYEVNTTQLGWQKFDLTSTVKEWYNRYSSETLRLLIDCTGCGKLYAVELFDDDYILSKMPSQNAMLSESKLHGKKNVTFTPDIRGDSYSSNTETSTTPIRLRDSEVKLMRPFLVLHTESKRLRRIRRRTINCNGALHGQCCKESFYVSFKALGWDDWIIAPRGYFANYCRGDCVGPYRTPDTFQTFHAHFIEEYRKMGLLNGMQPCCAPVKFSSMSLIYYGDEGIIKRDLPKMVVDECGCP